MPFYLGLKGFERVLKRLTSRSSNTKCLLNMGRTQREHRWQKGRLLNKRAILTAFKKSFPKKQIGLFADTIDF